MNFFNTKTWYTKQIILYIILLISIYEIIKS